MTFGQLENHISDMYAEISPVEKYSWVACAEADKECHLHKLSS